DRRLGRSGHSLRSCEEIELCLRLERAGERIRYAPDARVLHRVDAGRLTPAWMRARFAAQGFSEAVLEWKHGGVRALRAGERQLRAAAAGAGPLAPYQAAAAAAYRRGALYAVLAVPRWTPPGRGA